MTDPAAVSALASVWADPPGLGLDDHEEWWTTPRDLAEGVLAHPFTPAQRAAIAAELLTPEVLAEAMKASLLVPDSVNVADIVRGGMPADILAALRDAGKEPDR